MNVNEKVPAKCPVCGNKLALYIGKLENFLGCNGYPECRYSFNIKNFDKINCPVCGHPMVDRTGKNGLFLGCTNYPGCKFTFNIRIIKKVMPMKKLEMPSNKQIKSKKILITQTCPECNNRLLVYQGKSGFYYECSNHPICKFTKYSVHEEEDNQKMEHKVSEIKPSITKNIIINAVSDEWISFKELKLTLNLKEKMDFRFLLIKLKEFERKRIFQSTIINEVRFWKKFERIMEEQDDKSNFERSENNVELVKKELKTKITPLIKIIICHNCSNQNSAQTKFCKNCGKPLHPKNEIPAQNEEEEFSYGKLEFESSNSTEDKIYKKKKKKVKLYEKRKKLEPRINKNVNFSEHAEEYRERLEKFKKSLKIHKNFIKRKHNEKLYKELANKVSLRVQQIKIEMIQNSIYLCPFCKKNFDRNNRLMNHVEIKHNRRPITCPHCREKVVLLEDLDIHENMHFPEIDLHGYLLEEAIHYVKDKLYECHKINVLGLKLIHGYHHGQVLQNYFRSIKFINEMKHAGYRVKILSVKEAGMTQIICK